MTIQELSLHYLDSTDLIHDLRYDWVTNTFDLEDLSSQRYFAMSNSSLTAMYDQRYSCANTTLVAFQDRYGFIQVGNLTLNG